MTYQGPYDDFDERQPDPPAKEELVDSDFLVELKKDKARLDWLEDNNRVLCRTPEQGWFTAFFSGSCEPEEWKDGPEAKTLRGAIDAAMEAEK